MLGSLSAGLGGASRALRLHRCSSRLLLGWLSLRYVVARQRPGGGAGLSSARGGISINSNAAQPCCRSAWLLPGFLAQLRHCSSAAQQGQHDSSAAQQGRARMLASLRVSAGSVTLAVCSAVGCLSDPQSFGMAVARKAVTQLLCCWPAAQQGHGCAPVLRSLGPGDARWRLRSAVLVHRRLALLPCCPAVALLHHFSLHSPCRSVLTRPKCSRRGTMVLAAVSRASLVGSTIIRLHLGYLSGHR